MSDDTVNLEIDGVPVQAKKGQMLIEVTDRANIYVPRFCYHSKLSIAANCRMCLVQVEKAPKPLPACATPVAEGMKVFTRSDYAISAQKATMEFLLINHPLDCPICDQGGECELQDLAMGFGRGVSRYTERKRIVKDKNLGPLVSTDMTRCIQCTRCIRFGQEIAGIQELGAIGRSEQMRIDTYVEKSVDHELSGNIIDVCPVGALNNKPYRFGARAWEMIAKPIVSAHDCAGSNMYGHVLRGRLRRVVPRDNEAINETWLSDRDRYSCFGMYSEDRLETPMIKRDGRWAEVGWQEALAHARALIRQGVADEGDELGVLASPSSTLEELFLLRRIAEQLGSGNIDHRLRRRDFRDQDADPVWPALGTTIAGLEDRDGILVVGSNLRMEVPILAHRVRKAALGGADVGFVNPVDYPYLFGKSAFVEAPVERFAECLAGVLVAACKRAKKAVPKGLADALKGVRAGPEHEAAARTLAAKKRGLVLLGHIAQRHPHFSDIRVLASALVEATGAELGYLAEGANGVGAALTGFVPHRGAGGDARTTPGRDVRAMIASPRRVYLMFGIESAEDLSPGGLTEQALKSADAVICFNPFASEAMRQCADVLLPTGTAAETAGTFVNAEGVWQSFEAAANPHRDARPGWRVLRVLGNELGLAGFDYSSVGDVLEALRAEIGSVEANNAYGGSHRLELESADVALEALDVPIYAIDALVRRSAPLQSTVLARRSETAGGAEAKSA